MPRLTLLHPEPTKIAAIVLAAGESRRLGEPKQLVTFQGQSLIRNAALTALNSECDVTAVTLGSNSEVCLQEVGDLPVEILRVGRWSAGMSESIVIGATALQKRSDIAAMLVLLCDQPLVTSAALNELILKFKETGAPIVASGYNGEFGAPVIFARSLFSELISLSGDCGARDLIKRRRALLRSVPLPEAAVDIDTVEDLERLVELTDA